MLEYLSVRRRGRGRRKEGEERGGEERRGATKERLRRASMFIKQMDFPPIVFFHFMGSSAVDPPLVARRRRAEFEGYDGT